MNNQIVEKNKIVTLDYTILDNMGQVVEQNELPVTYLHGRQSEMFPRIVDALEGCKVGDQVNVELQPEEAFGPHDPELMFTDDIQNTPNEVRQIGAEMEACNEHGEVRRFRVVRIEEGRIIADANHPLAGKTVTFRVDVTHIRDPKPEELEGPNAEPVLH